MTVFKPKRCHSFSCLQFLQDLQLLICGLKGRIAYASSAFVYTNAIFASRFSYGSANYLLGTAQTLTILHPGMQAIKIEQDEGTASIDLLIEASFVFHVTLDFLQAQPTLYKKNTVLRQSRGKII